MVELEPFALFAAVARVAHERAACAVTLPHHAADVRRDVARVAAHQIRPVVVVGGARARGDQQNEEENPSYGFHCSPSSAWRMAVSAQAIVSSRSNRKTNR